MYNSVVAPECRLPRNIRENFVIDLCVHLQAFRKIQCERNNSVYSFYQKVILLNEILCYILIDSVLYFYINNL